MATPRKTKAEERAERLEYEEWLSGSQLRMTVLQSAVDTLHAELDKLTRKWPTMVVTDLMLQRTNKVVREAKSLMARDEDEFLQEVAEFIPAGDNPESRDVLLVLAELQAAIRRFRNRHHDEWRDL